MMQPTEAGIFPGWRMPSRGVAGTGDVLRGSAAAQNWARLLRHAAEKVWFCAARSRIQSLSCETQIFPAVALRAARGRMWFVPVVFQSMDWRGET